MRRRLRLGLLFAAVVLQIAAPLAAYARVAQLPDAVELCSAVQPAAHGQAHGDPFRNPAHQHCVESLCCVGAATGAAAPPATSFRSGATNAVAGPSVSVSPDPVTTAIVAAAPARGPPGRR